MKRVKLTFDEETSNDPSTSKERSVNLEATNEEESPLHWKGSEDAPKIEFPYPRLDECSHCSLCDVTFPGETEFRNHMIGHSFGKLFQCGVCKSQFSRLSTIKVHLLTHSSESWVCEQCNLRFQNEITLNRHAKRVHQDRKRFRCEICEKPLSSRQSLREHLKSHSNAKPFECSLCDKRFKSSNSLKSHSVVHTSETPFHCDSCPATFKRASVLKIHKLGHAGNRKFECDICKRRFVLKDAMKHHVIGHYDSKPYRCEVCDKRFSRPWSLKVHTFRHTGLKRFHCRLCDARFSLKWELKKHNCKT